MTGPFMAGRGLLVMVPGAYFGPEDFAAHGFLAVLERHDCKLDAVVANLPTDAYLAGTAAPWLRANIVAPALARGYGRLWLLGISLGGTGALLYAQEYKAAVEGMILLAPFLGTRGLVAEVEAAGGMASWEPGAIGPRDIERRMMARLKLAVPPRLHLGYGAADRYAPASRLLAARLPAERVVVIAGGHDWPTWERLWDAILDTRPFDPAQQRVQDAP